MKYVCTVIAALMLLATPMLRAQAAQPDQDNPPVGIQNHNPDGGRSWHGHGEGWDRGRGRQEENGRGWRGRDDRRPEVRHRARVRFGLFGWRWVWYWGPGRLGQPLWSRLRAPRRRRPRATLASGTTHQIREPGRRKSLRFGIGATRLRAARHARGCSRVSSRGTWRGS